MAYFAPDILIRGRQSFAAAQATGQRRRPSRTWMIPFFFFLLFRSHRSKNLRPGGPAKKSAGIAGMGDRGGWRLIKALHRFTGAEAAAISDLRGLFYRRERARTRAAPILHSRGAMPVAPTGRLVQHPAPSDTNQSHRGPVSEQEPGVGSGHAVERHGISTAQLAGLAGGSSGDGGAAQAASGCGRTQRAKAALCHGRTRQSARKRRLQLPTLRTCRKEKRLCETCRPAGWGGVFWSHRHWRWHTCRPVRLRRDVMEPGSLNGALCGILRLGTAKRFF